jgi:glycine/D-amino acid oxidase-like deaminating enzyme
MPEQVDVAVVGAGVIGLSVARELRRAGVDRVVVLEREAAAGQGSSSRGNGGVRAQWATRVNVEFSAFSIAELERLEAATGLPGFRQAGYLLFTGTEAGERGLRAGFELQRSLGVMTEWLAPDAVLGRAPFLRPDGLRAGTFHARDGLLDPRGVVAALLREAGEVETGAEVVAIERTGGAFHVSTRARMLRARQVVNAAGPGAAKVAAMLGVELPVAPVRRNLAHVPHPDGPAETIPMCVDLDTGVLVRRHRDGGFVVAWSDPDDPPSWDTSVDPAFPAAVARRVGQRFPLLDGVPIDPARCWAGLYPETPDHHAVIGEVAEVPGFVQCAGFGGHGVMHAPAAGRAVAELISAGRSATFDLHPLRPSRFADGDLVAETVVL